MDNFCGFLIFIIRGPYASGRDTCVMGMRAESERKSLTSLLCVLGLFADGKRKCSCPFMLNGIGLAHLLRDAKRLRAK